MMSPLNTKFTFSSVYNSVSPTTISYRPAKDVWVTLSTLIPSKRASTPRLTEASSANALAVRIAPRNRAGSRDLTMVQIGSLGHAVHFDPVEAGLDASPHRGLIGERARRENRSQKQGRQPRSHDG